jgi:hypothetical protein
MRRVEKPFTTSYSLQGPSAAMRANAGSALLLAFVSKDHFKKKMPSNRICFTFVGTSFWNHPEFW